MLGSFGWMELLVILIFVGLPIWAGSRIAKKAGFAPFWAITLIVPLVNFVVIWSFAFVEWPNVPHQAPAKNSSRGT